MLDLFDTSYTNFEPQGSCFYCQCAHNCFECSTYNNFKKDTPN